MKYEEFLDYIEENLIKYLPFAYQDAKVKYISYLKDGKQSESMIISRSTANGIGISPAIPLAPIYTILREGTGIDNVMRILTEDYLYGVEHQNTYVKLDLSRENVLKNLCTAAVNHEMTDLDNIPYLQVNDLAIVAKFRILDKGYLTITDAIAAELGINGDAIVEQAIENNIKAVPPVLQNMEQRFHSNKPGIAIDDLEPGMLPQRNSLWSLSNRERAYGASYIANKDVLHKIAMAMDSDLIIAPGTIHELVIFPRGAVSDVSLIKDVVRGGREKIQAPHAFLSDNVYIYDASAKKLNMYDNQIKKEFVQVRQKPAAPHL